MSAFTIEVESGTSVKLPTAGKYCDRDIVVAATEGSGGYEEGFADGKQAEYNRLVDPAKIIEKTVSGSVIRVDDVSEIPHKCTVSVDKDASVSVCGKNLFDGYWESGYISIYTGADAAGSDCIRTGYIPLIPGVTYYFSVHKGRNYYPITYDKDKVFMQCMGLKADSFFFKAQENERYLRLCQYGSAEVDESIRLEIGSTATAYEPYQCTTHAISAGQTIEVDSICPTMTLFADNDATITFGYHKSWGMQAEYDRFWDAYQDSGNRTNYHSAFAGKGWTDDTYNPKYPLKVAGTYAENMFFQSEISETEIDVDFSESTAAPGCFRDSKIRRIKLFDSSGLNNSTSALNWTFASRILEQLTLICKEGTPYNNTFYQCYGLKELTIAGGVISKSINFQWSDLLSDASVQSVIDHLKDLTGATAQTITFHADVGAKLTDAQKATITAKSWTLVY